MIVGEAVRLSARPGCIPQPRRAPRGAKGAGLQYEARVAEALRRAGAHVLVGQWYEYRDQSNIRRYCQTDCVLPLADRVVVLECKLSRIAQAREQIEELYVPVLRAVFGRPACGVIVTRHVSRARAGDLIVPTLREALALASATCTPVLHWLGKGAL